MKEYIISAIILVIIMLILYSLYKYNKYITQYDNYFFKENWKNKIILYTIRFIKICFIIAIFIWLLVMTKTTLFG